MIADPIIMREFAHVFRRGGKQVKVMHLIAPSEVSEAALPARRATGEPQYEVERKERAQ